MNMNFFYTLLVTGLIAGITSAQNEDIPFENDNQFSPDVESETVIEGSGDTAVVDEPITDSTTESISSISPPVLGNSRFLIEDEQIPETETNSTELPCPKPCVCHTEGDTENFVVDCSGYDLTEFPSPIDARTTTLKLHNNKLTEIPKEISALKKLKVLNACNNSIMEIASGSVSELPELLTLKLGNNRLIEYPKDLKNSLSLFKLEELDLGNNDMRTTLLPEMFSNFKALRKLTLPAATPEFMLDLCGSLKPTIETICVKACESQSLECPDAPPNIEEDLFDATLPGMIPFNTPIVEEEHPEKQNSDTEETHTATTVSTASEAISHSNDNASAIEFSLRAAVDSAPEEKIAPLNFDSTSPTTETSDVKVGAKTADTKAGSGGVDKSVIGIVVAGMVVIVAGITVKKNWSSIKKRFSSTPNRAANERSGGSANGTTVPEEIPLQEKLDKSPV